MIRTLLIFVDGLGWPFSNPGPSPIVEDVCPTLVRLLRHHGVPIDPVLGVDGIPQSATGQTALLTGLNAPRAIGRHVEGFPGPELKKLIRSHNIFRKLTERGYRPVFANAFFVERLEEVVSRRWQSVTTVAALDGVGWLFLADSLYRDEAVYQDLTRESLVPRGYSGPLIAPRDAAQHLVRIGTTYDFTLFEFFQTDRAGHTGDWKTAERVLQTLDEFLAALLSFVDQPDHLLVLTSDHGNIEDMSTLGHTRNPVPFVAMGAAAHRLLVTVRTLVDVVPALLALYPERLASMTDSNNRKESHDGGGQS